MPQMMPMNWTIMLMFFIMIIYIIMIMMYFFYLKSPLKYSMTLFPLKLKHFKLYW